MCLMAHEEDKVCDSIFTSPSIDEVIDKYDDLASLHQDLKKAYDILMKTSEKLAQDNIDKESKIKTLKYSISSEDKEIFFLKIM